METELHGTWRDRLTGCLVELASAALTFAALAVLVVTLKPEVNAALDAVRAALPFWAR